MTDTAAAPLPGITAAEAHWLQQGAREFFEAQGAAVLAELARREGTDPLTGEFRALARPAAAQVPAHREVYDKRDSMHWMYMGHHVG
jgi:hypothetical protein